MDLQSHCFKASNSATSVYPVTLLDYINDNERHDIHSKEELESVLKTIFNSDKLKEVISNLLIQIEDNSDMLDF